MEINGSGKEKILSPVLIPTQGKIKKAAAGTKFSLYLTTDGQLYGWGNLVVGEQIISQDN
ncbi:alpha-tubulin suppressor-like RCC1 family protein [Fontibacillus solani]|uniref:Alpha-tubulin suppressor-like RCC1 family protein n=1 Tax=Fontibacillus solani TaxID=1572857 RepID=A0A7W3SV75_9BACL|nr:RCC1 domain-containing protein [Fontibacillus solani]MBA9086881.1 alpha-tubulin suppressor-like RCC1 family protein [Fontibacillus solani]